MTRDEFEHVIRAAAAIVGDDIVVIGSQAILAQHPDAPSALLVSQELDVYPRSHPERADDIDGAIGELSAFHDTYGVYAHGVGPDTPIAPAGWESRLIRIDVPSVHSSSGTVTAWCMEAHDLVLSKIAANRPKDIAFARAAVRATLVSGDHLLRSVEDLPEDFRERARWSLRGILNMLDRGQRE